MSVADLLLGSSASLQGQRSHLKPCQKVWLSTARQVVQAYIAYLAAKGRMRDFARGHSHNEQLSRSGQCPRCQTSASLKGRPLHANAVISCTAGACLNPEQVVELFTTECHLYPDDLLLVCSEHPASDPSGLD